MADKYLMVLHAGSDDLVQRAINNASARANGVTLAEFMQMINDVTNAPSLTMIICGSDERITLEGRANFLRSPIARDAVIYPIKDDGTVDFGRAIYGANVDQKYLQP